MKKHICFILALLTLILAVSCGNPVNTPSETSEAETAKTAASAGEPTAAETATAPREITVADMIGRDVKVVPGSYKRVVCIGAGALRMYSYIGDAALLCGVEDIENTTLENRPKMFDAAPRPYVLAFGEIYKTLPSCGVGGPNAQTAEAEKILSCAPDIVISEYEDADKENALQAQLGVPVITLRSGADGVFGDLFKGTVTLLGQIFCREEKAAALISFIEREEAEIIRRTETVKEEEKPGVFICGLGNWGTASHLTTAQNYISFDVANVRNVVEDLAAGGIQKIDEEKFLSLGEKTDIIILDAAAVKNIKPLLKEDPTLFDHFTAKKNGKIYLEMAYNAYYTNYEIALANTWFVAKSVYPDLFADVDMTAKLNEITKAFLGAELADAVYACGASFGGYQKIDFDAFFT
ncbi:MAG: ABC transporter substrate-binding protein [Clostridia bacterium]|nr:ABC transporter substrate-binding protein [Clostridia bacterium]